MPFCPERKTSAVGDGEAEDERGAAVVASTGAQQGHSVGVGNCIDTRGEERRPRPAVSRERVKGGEAACWSPWTRPAAPARRAQHLLLAAQGHHALPFARSECAPPL